MILLIIFLLGLLAIGGCWLAISITASGKNFDTAEETPHNRVGLLLGTSPITRFGAHNLYFDTRIEKAAELYNGGKVEHLILSGGDYTGKQEFGCDEPAAMRDSLIAKGVPAEAMTLDYEGLRTLNSILKAKEVYGLDSLTLISQKYHNERALFLAKANGVEAVAINAELPNRRRLKNVGREVFARVKMFVDFVREPKPVFKDREPLPLKNDRKH